MNCEGCGREQSCILRYCDGICLQRVNKSRRTSHGSLCSDRHLNLAPLECKSEAVPLKPALFYNSSPISYPTIDIVRFEIVVLALLAEYSAGQRQAICATRETAGMSP
jgi:hypothetical protein